MIIKVLCFAFSGIKLMVLILLGVLEKKLQNICGLAFKNVQLCVSHDTKEGWRVLIYNCRENDTKGCLSKKQI